jgi:hypothetical protein
VLRRHGLFVLSLMLLLVLLLSLSLLIAQSPSRGKKGTATFFRPPFWVKHLCSSTPGHGGPPLAPISGSEYHMQTALLLTA